MVFWSYECQATAAVTPALGVIEEGLSTELLFACVSIPSVF